MSEWEPPEAPSRTTGKLLLVLIFAAWLTPTTVVALTQRGYWTWLAIALAVMVVAWVLVQRRLLMAKAVRARADGHPRFVNIARGLATDLGLAAPTLWISPSPGPNAFVVPGAVVVTGDLVASYTRTELEAVVAHCLVRLQRGGLGWALAAAAVRGAGGWATPRVDRIVDARAAAVTRYPPALASAIEKSAPARGPAAGLWFVADAPSHAPVKERIAELLDL